MFRLSWNLGTSASWNPQGLSRPPQELLCLYRTCCLSNHQMQHNNLLLRRPKAFCSSSIITGFHTTNDGHAVGYEVLQQCWWRFGSPGIWRPRPLGLWRWRQQSLSKVVNFIQSTSYHFPENEPSRPCTFADWTLFPFLLFIAPQIYRLTITFLYDIHFLPPLLLFPSYSVSRIQNTDPFVGSAWSGRSVVVSFPARIYEVKS